MNKYVGKKINIKIQAQNMYEIWDTGKNLIITNIKEETQVKSKENIFKKYRMKFS